MTLRRVAPLVVALLAVAACSSDESSDPSAPPTDAAPTTPTETTDDTGDEEAATFSEERCEANRAAGEITFLTSFDYAAAASIIDVVRAEQAGYFDQVCLDVTVTPSLSTENYPMVAAGEAQISSGGSFSEVASFSANTGGDFVVIGVAGNAPIDVLLAKPDIGELSDLDGATIGVQGATPMPIAAMLADAGLPPDSYTAVSLGGFDAAANLEPDELSAISGYKSNEPGQLRNAGVEFNAFDPAEAGIPGSFGAYYTSAEFAEAYPTAVEDFMRASMRGLRDALDDPPSAVDAGVSLAEEAGNPYFLNRESESFRWSVEAALVQQTRPPGLPLGTPDVDGLQAELDAYAPFGLFGDGDAPVAADLVDASYLEAVYDEDRLIWPFEQPAPPATGNTPATTTGDASGTTVADPDTTTAPTATTAGTAAAGPIDEARCARNRDAGKVTFLTGFDFAAAASILEVITAEDQGFYDDMCLDVELTSSFSTGNYPLVASGTAQFASGGSFSETAAAAINTDADLKVVMVAGSEPIDTLLIKPEAGSSLTDLEGATIGVKGKLPASVEVMLSNAGLTAGEDYETVSLDGFDPVAHMSYDETVGVPGWRSNEPGRLLREDIEFVQFDPADFDVPGSFGVIFTSQDFIDEHPTAAEDFVTATMKGLETSLADPEAAATAAIELIEANGNPNFLSPETEAFRAETEAEIIAAATPDGVAPGTPLVDELQAELDAYAPTGLFGDHEVLSAADLVWKP